MKLALLSTAAGVVCLVASISGDAFYTVGAVAVCIAVIEGLRV